MVPAAHQRCRAPTKGEKIIFEGNVFPPRGAQASGGRRAPPPCHPAPWVEWQSIFSNGSLRKAVLLASLIELIICDNDSLRTNLVYSCLFRPEITGLKLDI